MNESTVQDRSNNRRIILLIGIALIAATVYFLLRFVMPPGISTEDVVANSDEYLGRTITVRGIAAGMIFEATLNECEPFECDCNTTYSKYFFLGPGKRDNLGYGLIETLLIVNALDCNGNECTMSCERLVYKNGQMYAFTGRLDEGFRGELSLEDVNLNKSYRRVGLFWLPVSQFGGQIDVR